MEQPDWKVPTRHDIRKIDALFYGIQFNDLLHLATETCLQEPLPDIPYTPNTDPEARLIQHLGLRGLQTALLFIHGEAEPVAPSESANGDADDLRIVKSDSPLRQAEVFSDSLAPERIHQVRLFGDALMRESYAILGADADEQLAKLQTAETVAQQLEVVTWLDQRLSDLTDTAQFSTGRPEQNEGPLRYHPVRLSPKLIGEFPAHALSPTCLSVSVIAAEFFRRAGIETLHAGVMRSHGEDRLEMSEWLFDEVLDTRARRNETSLLDDALTAKRHLVHERTHADTAYHAAVYAKLQDGSWLQFDSNYEVTSVLGSMGSPSLQQAYDAIQSMADIAPGLELPVRVSESVSLSMLYQGRMAEVLDNSIDPLGVILDDAVSGNRESFAQRVFDDFIQPALMCPSDEEAITYAQEFIGRLVTIEPEEPFLQSLFYRLFDKFALWGGSLDDTLDRCTKDGSYRQRFAQDIAGIVAMMIAQLCLDEAATMGDALAYGPSPHAFVEVGLPETRIGFAALSDFAQYCDTSLPPSFWLSNWSSQVPVTESMGLDERDHQKALLWNNAIALSIARLTYIRSDDIVNEFLDRNDNWS